MLLKLFRSFYVQNYPSDMEQTIDAFALFGGLGRPLNLDNTLEALIEQEVLEHYGELYNIIGELTQYNDEHQRLLSAIARGDRRIHSAFKRARISEAKGGMAINELRRQGLLSMEYSREVPPQKLHPKQRLKREVLRHRISHKMRFTLPFLRFWFFFIAPFHQAIMRGDYESVLAHFEQHRYSFSSYVFEELSNIYLLWSSKEELLDLGSYWDRHVEIDILARTQGGKTVVGECKWTNHKINRKELHRLEEKCHKIGLEYDAMLFFSKRGFSNELTNTKSNALQLYTAENLADLLQDATKSEILPTPFS